MPYVDYEISPSDAGGVINANTENGEFAILLPTPSAGFNVTVKDESGNAGRNKVSILRKEILGSELVTNGTFNANLTGWTANANIIATWNAGQYVDLTRNGANSAFYQTITTVVGQVYRLSFTLLQTVGAGGSLEFWVNTGTDPLAGTVITRKDSITTPGVYTIQFTALTTQTTMRFYLETQPAATAKLDNISMVAVTLPKIDGEANDDLIISDFGSISYVSDGSDWFRVSSWQGFAGIGFIGGGAGMGGSPTLNNLEYMDLGSAKVSVDFGDLTVARSTTSAASSRTRGIWAGGLASGSPNNTIDYIEFATLGNAASFGTLGTARYILAGCSNQVRALFGGGATPANSSVVEYVTIATTGNGSGFGNLTVARQSPAALANQVRCIWGGGFSSGYDGTIDYSTIATAAAFAGFGSLTVSRMDLGAAASSVRGTFMGGWTGTQRNEIDYIQIATTSSAVDFGDLTAARYGGGAMSNSLRGYYAGGAIGTQVSMVDTFVFNTLGNATSFGELVISKSGSAGCSNAHGGL